MTGNRNAKIISKLNSTHESEILDGLYDVQKIKDKVFVDDIKNLLISFLKHSNPDIREQAINVVGIVYRLPDSYSVIKEMLNQEDQAVLGVVCNALGALISSGVGSKSELSPKLASIVVDQNLDPDIRGTAYLNLQRINDSISLNEFAASDTDINLFDNLDIDWVRVFLKEEN